MEEESGDSETGIREWRVLMPNCKIDFVLRPPCLSVLFYRIELSHHLCLSTHTSLACTPLTYPSIGLPLLLGPLISLAHIFLTNSSLSQEDQTTSNYLFLPIPLHQTLLYFPKFPFPLSLLSPSHFVTTPYAPL